MVVAGSKIQNFRQWLAMLAILFICGMGISGLSHAQAEPAEPEALSNILSSLVSGNRDSMMLEIKKYTEEISALRDSLVMGGDDVEISDAQRERFQASIDDIAVVIGDITEELSHLEFEISDNMISLLDESGEGIVINIPENLDDQVKAGIESITQIILAQLPDTVQVDPRLDWNWLGEKQKAPEVQRRISHGNVVKVWDDLLVEQDEDIRGDIVVVVGDVRIEGRVKGSVTVVLGDLELAEGAEILGDVVVVMGRVMEEDVEIIGDVTIVDPLGSGDGLTLNSLKEKGGLVFLASQGVFIFVLAIVLLGMAVFPESRIKSVISTIQSAPGLSLGMGFVVAMLGHMVVLLLMAMLVLTVIGIPLALLFALLMGIVWLVATGAVSLVLGEKLVAVLGVNAPSRWIGVLVGMIALHTLSFIGAGIGAITGLQWLSFPLTLLGGLVKTTAYLFGLGALLVSRLGTK